MSPVVPVPRHPVAPQPAPVAPAAPAPARANIVTVQSGDSLWKIATEQLGNGLRWHELLSVNPGIRNPDHIEAGSQIVLPTSVSTQRTSTKYTVRKGDSLWSIAQAQLGHATSWSCIAQANPSILDANFIREGQILSVPSSCRR